jgi:prepilin-type N-terminal cleavage/methylation domain-containing protein
MKFFRPKKATGFTLVEIMIVVLIIGILLAIAIPNFVSARESGRARACVANLKQIDSAKQQAAIDNKIANTDATTFTASAAGTGNYELVGANGTYLRKAPACPSSGTYTIGAINASPLCSVGTAGTGDYGGPNSTTAVNPAGKFYHGL